MEVLLSGPMMCDPLHTMEYMVCMPGGKRELGSQPSSSMVWTRMDFHQLSKGPENSIWVEFGGGVFAMNDGSPLF